MKYLIMLMLLVNDVALACEAMVNTQFQERLKKEPAAQLVFFASWCASCKKHLVKESLATSYFIAAFDEQSAAIKAYSSFMGESALHRCIWDKDGSIAAAYGVKALPLIKSLQN